MDKKIIDIDPYLSGLSEGAPGKTFSVWGGEGMRARLALPVWRAIRLLGGERGGIVLLEEGKVDPRPFFLLDLLAEAARMDCTPDLLDALLGKEAPAMAFGPGGEVAVLLGWNGKSSWYLQVWGRDSGEPLDGGKREKLLFLAGECAGLLFFRELTEAGP